MEVALPATEITIQEIVDQIRDFEDEPSPSGGMDIPHILDAAGKQPLGGTDSVGMTITLRDWTIKFADRGGPDWVTCNIRGGNIVAYNTTTQEYVVPITPAEYVNTNITASSSATLSEQSSIQFSSFQNMITIDVANGTAGTAFPIGTYEQPVNNLADAQTIAIERGLSMLHILGNITLGASANIDGYEIVGQNSTLSTITVTGGCSTEGTEFLDCELQGTLDGSTKLRNVDILNLSGFKGHAEFCCLGGTITVAGTSSEQALLTDCHQGSVGIGAIEINMNGDSGALAMRNYSGAIKITNKSGSSKAIFDFAQGRIELASSITAGDFILRGVGIITSNDATGINLDTSGLVSPSSVANSTWDETTAEARTQGSYGKHLRRIRNQTV